jgi:hypothetical protein
MDAKHSNEEQAQDLLERFGKTDKPFSAATAKDIYQADGEQGLARYLAQYFILMENVPKLFASYYVPGEKIQRLTTRMFHQIVGSLSSKNNLKRDCGNSKRQSINMCRVIYGFEKAHGTFSKPNKPAVNVSHTNHIHVNGLYDGKRLIAYKKSIYCKMICM